MKQRYDVVISAINIFSAGPLSVVRDFLAELSAWRAQHATAMSVLVFVHDRVLYKGLDLGGFEIVEIPRSRKNWLFRLFYEYVWFYFWSRRREIVTWISMHDLTPRVVARHRVAYCHHASPFYKGPASSVGWEWRFEIPRRFYLLFYRLNIRRNDLVIVQQQWLRDAFRSRFGLAAEQVIVAFPRRRFDASVKPAAPQSGGGDTVTFFYPSFPRFFKNFEVTLEAMSRIADLPARLIVTFDGTETPYAADLRRRYGNLKNIEFAGFVSREQVIAFYRASAAVIFASRLESFGLPLVELQEFAIPVFASNLPYAHEALSGYDKVRFFDPGDPGELAQLLRRFVEENCFDPTPVSIAYVEPFAADWRGLIDRMAQRGILQSP